MSRQARETGRYEGELWEVLKAVRPADQRAKERAKRRWASVAKPIGSLGVLEEDVIKIAGITGSADRIDLEKTALTVICADHGVALEGVTQTGQEVTRIVAENFTKDSTSVTKMCRVAGTDVFPVDMGMLGERAVRKEPVPFALLDRKVREGSRDLLLEAAMTREETAAALLSGIRLAGDLKRMGYGLLAVGEMGIGNTTPTGALMAVLLRRPAEAVTGRGAGLSDAGYARKTEVVRGAAERFYAKYPDWNSLGADASLGVFPGKEDALTLLSELGGFDIAGMAGVFLGGAVSRIPVVADGIISTVSAALAACLCRLVPEFLLASHVSREPGGEALLKRLGLFAPLHLGMHLGEGSGAVAMIPLLKMGAAVYNEMSTFEEIKVEAYVDYGAGEGGEA